MEQEKNEESFVKKVVQTALEAERQIRRQQVLHNTRMLMEEYIEMKRHIESAVSEEEELKEEQYDIFRGEGAHLGSVRRSKMKTAMMIANIDRAMEELRAEYETKEMTYKYDAFKMHIQPDSRKDTASCCWCRSFGWIIYDRAGSTV